jgi:hypothetical protein
MDRDIIDQDIAEGGIDLGPLPRSFFYAPQDQGISFCESYITVIPALLSYGHHIGPYLRHRVTHVTKGIGDNLCPTAGCDLKKGMTEPFDLNRP